MDAQGAQVARLFREAAGVRFATAVDRVQALWQLYDFDVVPNRFFVDEQGVLPDVNVGGFEVRNPERAQGIDNLLADPAGETVGAYGKSPHFGTVEKGLGKGEAALSREPESLDCNSIWPSGASKHASTNRPSRTSKRCSRRIPAQRAPWMASERFASISVSGRKLRVRPNKPGLSSPTTGSSANRSGPSHTPSSSTPINTRWQRERIQKEKAAENYGKANPR